MAHETGVPDTVDPIGGAYAIEALTSELEKRITQSLQRIRAEGGMLRLIERGVPQAEIQERAYQYQQEIESNRRRIVGVNSFKLDDDSMSKKARTLKVSPRLESEQVKRLKSFKKSRDSKAAQAVLSELAACARSDQNMFPSILRCVENAATLGEICGTLRKEFGEYAG